jgi:hypothetical protein
MMAHQVPSSDLSLAHDHCFKNRKEVEQSASCGCFHCKKTFASSEIEDWTDEGETALCPKCGLDAVLGDKGVSRAADEDFLRQMRRQWFGAGNA